METPIQGYSIPFFTLLRPSDLEVMAEAELDVPHPLSRQHLFLSQALEKILRVCRFVIFWGSSELIRLAPARRPLTSVLVLRLDAIGDLVLWLSTGIREISQYGRSRGYVVLLARQDWADFARELGIFDEVLPLDTQRFMTDLPYRLALLLMLRRRGFALVIQTRAAREFLLEDMIVRAVGATETLGNAGDTSNIRYQLKRVSDKWYSRLILVPSHSTHESERNKVFTRALTGATPQPVAMQFDSSISKQFEIAGSFFVVAPGAGWYGRQWPATRFAEVASRLQQKKGWMCVVVGGVNDCVLGESIQEIVGQGCVNLAGQLTLLELGGILKSAELVITNESSVAHYAPFVGTKTVVILGGGHFGRFLPYASNMPESRQSLPIFKAMDCFGCNWVCRFSVPIGAPMPCIEQVDVDNAWNKMREGL